VLNHSLAKMLGGYLPGFAKCIAHSMSYVIVHGTGKCFVVALITTFALCLLKIQEVLPAAKVQSAEAF